MKPCSFENIFFHRHLFFSHIWKGKSVPSLYQICSFFLYAFSTTSSSGNSVLRINKRMTIIRTIPIVETIIRNGALNLLRWLLMTWLIDCHLLSTVGFRTERNSRNWIYIQITFPTRAPLCTLCNAENWIISHQYERCFNILNIARIANAVQCHN